MRTWIKIGGAALALITLGACSAPDRYHVVGKPAPPFKISPLTPSSDVSLPDFKGKVVLIDFWATWCGPCKMLMPYLSRLQDKYGSKGLVVLGVTTDPREVVQAFRAQNPSIRYDFFLDPTSKNAQMYGASNLPTTVLIGKDGTIQYYDVGFDDDLPKQLEDRVDSLTRS